MGIFLIKHILFLLIQKSGFLSHKNFGYFMGRKTGRKGALLYAPLRPVCYNIHLFSPVVNNEYLRNCLIICLFYIYWIIVCLFADFISNICQLFFCCFLWNLCYTLLMGHWRSWERATLAVWRSRVQVPYAPFFITHNIKNEKRYTELKVILTASGINLTELNFVKEQQTTK